MGNTVNSSENSGKRLFVNPELVVLDVRGTRTGGTADPNEFNPFLQESIS